MSDIFISYAREDRERAAVLASVLAKHGWTVFWDRQILPGAVFDEVIERELTSARCVVALWSAASVASQWVRNEVNEGANRGILVSVLLENVRPPLAFRLIQAADLSEWNGDPADQRVSDVLEAVWFLVEKPQDVPAAAPSKVVVLPRPRVSTPWSAGWIGKLVYLLPLACLALVAGRTTWLNSHPQPPYVETSREAVELLAKGNVAEFFRRMPFDRSASNEIWRRRFEMSWRPEIEAAGPVRAKSRDVDLIRRLTTYHLQLAKANIDLEIFFTRDNRIHDAYWRAIPDPKRPLVP